MLAVPGDEDYGASALDLYGGGVPELDGASNVGVELGEELPPACHVVGGAGVEAPPIDLVAGAEPAAEEGMCLGLVEVEKSRCSRCCWRWLGASMCHEQSWLLLLRLRDVGLGASWLPAVLSPMARKTTVLAAVILCRLGFFGGALDTSAGASVGTPLRPGLGAFA